MASEDPPLAEVGWLPLRQTPPPSCALTQRLCPEGRVVSDKRGEVAEGQLWSSGSSALISAARAAPALRGAERAQQAYMSMNGPWNSP